MFCTSIVDRGVHEQRVSKLVASWEHSVLRVAAVDINNRMRFTELDSVIIQRRLLYGALFFIPWRLSSIFFGTACLPRAAGSICRICIQFCFKTGSLPCAPLLGDCGSLVCYSFIGTWNCLRIYASFILWKIGCKFVFENEVSSFSAFCSMWCDEVCHQLLTKSALLIKDAQIPIFRTHSLF